MNESVFSRDVPPSSSRAPKPTFKHTTKLLIALIPPLLVTVMFGGKPAILVFSYGALVTYIFDLLGSIEGTFLSFASSLLAVWGTLLWAGRVLLSESILYFTLLLVMGSLLSSLFILFCASFDVILKDFTSIVTLFESILFAIIPLLSSVTLTWFICVEIPGIDIAKCFTVIYFLYSYILYRPHRSFLQSSSNVLEVSEIIDSRSLDFVLSPATVFALDIYPIVASLAISLTNNHSVFLVSRYYLLKQSYPIILSTFLLTLCLRGQRPYLQKFCNNNDHSVTNIQSIVETLKLISGSILLLYFESNPAFSDVRQIAYQRKHMVPVAVFFLTACCASMLVLYRLRKRWGLTKDEELYTGNDRTSSWVFVDLVIRVLGVACAWLVTYIINAPLYVMIVAAIAGACFAEFYLSIDTCRTLNRSDLVKPISLACYVAFTVSLIVRSFFHQTLTAISVDLTWIIDVSIENLCTLCSVTGALAILVPAVGQFIRKHIARKDVLLPGDVTAHSVRDQTYGIDGHKLSPQIFEVLFQFIAMVITAIELLIREQNWKGDLGVDVEAVYPAYLLIITAALIGLTAYHCWSTSLMRLSSVWLIWLSQSIKMLHLLGLPSKAAGAVGALIYAHFSPFVSLYKSQSDIRPDSYVDTMSVAVKAWQISQAALSLFWFYRHIASRVFSSILLRSPTAVQLVCGCLAIYTCFLSAYFYVYLPTLAFARGLFVIVAITSAFLFSGTVIGLDAFLDWCSRGTADPVELSTLKLSFRSDSSSASICLILSVFLVFAAYMNVFPMKQSLCRLLFLIMVSVSTTEALIGWCYPLNLSADSPTHNIISYPFVHTLVLTFIAVSTIMHSNFSRTSDVGDKVFLAGILWVVGGAVLCVVQGELEQFDGTLWTSASTSAGVALTTSLTIILQNRSNSTGSADSLGETSSTATAVCGMASVTNVLSVFALSMLGHHRIEQDFLLPLSTSVLLTTKKNLFVQGVHPSELAVVISIFWWLSRMIFLIFLQDYGLKDIPVGFEQTYGLFHNTTISIWSSALPKWLILCNLLMGLLPLPAVLLSFLKRPNESEEMMFMLAVLSLVPLIGAQANCIRFIGGFSAVYTCWRCYSMNRVHSSSERVI